MMCEQDEAIVAAWREHGIPNDPSTREAAARIVLKLADERDQWQAVALELADHDCSKDAA